MAIKNKRLKFLRGSTYTFDVSDSALATNPLKFTADSGATEYTSGITLTGTQGQSGATLQFVVDSGTPNNLNYFGDSSSLKMGNHILVPGTVATLGDISSASGSLGLQAGSNNSQWFEFNGDGTALFVHNTGSGGNAPAGYLLNKYTLSTPYDLTTATYSNDEYYGSGNDFEGKFSGDGMRFYYNSGSGWMHNLASAYEPGTNIRGPGAEADGAGPGGESWCFSHDGYKLYTLAISNIPNGVVYSEGTTAWDTTTFSIPGGSLSSSNTFNYGNEMTGASNIEMNSTGTKLYILTRYSTISGTTNPTIVEYDFTTPYDITTLTYNGKYLSLGADGFQSVERISFRLENDRKIFVKAPNTNHSGNDAIYQYTIPYASTSSGGGGGGGGGGASADYTDSSLSESFFLNAVKAYDSDVGINTYSAFSTNLTSRFSDPESLTTNGEYTCVTEHGLMLEHSGPGSTGTAKVSMAGWAWIIRNRDGALMKSWNGLIRDYDHTNLDEEEFNYLNTNMQYSKYHTAQWGCSVASNEKYLFVASGYRPSSSSAPNRNWADDRAFIFVYDFTPPFALRKIIKLEDFNTTDVAHSGSTGYRGGGSGWTEHGHQVGEDWLIVPAAYADYYGNATSSGRLTYWDISDSDPSNWSSTPDAVIQNPINVVNTPTQTWNSVLYSTRMFGQGGGVIRHNKLTTGHSIFRYTYTKSGNSFSLNTSTTVGPYKNYSRPPYLAWTDDSSSPKFLQFNYGTAGSSTTRQIQLIDPSNSHNADWTYDLNAVSGAGYPFGMRHLTVGKDVKTELFSYGDAYRGGNGKSGQIRFVKASDRSEVFNLDNPFIRDSDGLYFGDNYEHHAIDSDNSNRYSLVAWGEPDDVDNKDIYSFWELKWDSDNGVLRLDLPWNGSRALAPGGNSPAETNSYSNVIQYFDITTLGDAQDFGDLTEIKNGVCAVGNGTRCVIMGGQGRTSTQTPPGSGRYLDEMEYVSFATPGNAVSFGLLGTGVHDAAAGSNGTRGIIGGGDAGPSSSTATDAIQYITIDTTGGSSSFGNLTAETHMGMSTNDNTYLGFLEGYTSSGGFGYRNTNTWVTMDTLGNSVNQGSFTYGIGNGGKGIVSDNTYGVVFGGNEDYTSGGTSWNNNIYYLTIATKSDASDFGDCITSLGHAGQTSYVQTKRGVSIGGFYNPGTVTIDTISHIVIDTPGNAQDFGDLTQATEYSYGVSGNAA